MPSSPLRFLFSPEAHRHLSSSSSSVVFGGTDGGRYEDSFYSHKQREFEFPISSPLIVPSQAEGAAPGYGGRGAGLVFAADMIVAALRRSLVLCSTGGGDEGVEMAAGPSGMEIGWPTDVRHVSHVTFDRFDGFLGVPTELEPEVPRPAPSASVSVFGVSPHSMQCSYDTRGNSVPTILLLMQRHLYMRGGLRMEGIFRINADNSQEIYVRDQLNRGVVPDGVDMHCLSGLIKAWFRELPTGILDLLTQDQLLHCNTENECAVLATTLPPMEASLLDWAVNLMADVVKQERFNKMNTRNIAMVFAPNMTQMADPLTALIHAVQVMNFLKTLITKVLREREEASLVAGVSNPCSESPSDKEEPVPDLPLACSSRKDLESLSADRAFFNKFLFGGEPGTKDYAGWNVDENHNHRSYSVDRSRWENISCRNLRGLSDKFSFRFGSVKLCQHPVFQSNRNVKKTRELSVL